MIPTDNKESIDIILGVGATIIGYFLTFVGGIVAATWAVAAKVKGFDSRLFSVEETQRTCQSGNLADIKTDLSKIDGKIDQIHRRIDEILLRDK